MACAACGRGAMHHRGPSGPVNQFTDGSDSIDFSLQVQRLVQNGYWVFDNPALQTVHDLGNARQLADQQHGASEMKRRRYLGFMKESLPCPNDMAKIKNSIGHFNQPVLR